MIELLSDLINEDVIELNVNATNWEEAVRIGGELLEKNHAVENRYVDAMVHMVRKLGPYIVISKGIAFPHARPEDGVLKTGLSLITLKEGIEFGDKDNDPIRLIISFCSTDAEGHLQALSELVDFIRDEAAVDSVINARSKKEIIRIIERLYSRVEY